METLKMIFGTLGTILVCLIPFIAIFIHDVNKDIDPDELWIYGYAVIITVMFAGYISNKLFGI